MDIAVIGGGSWGTTLSNLLAIKGFNVTLWVYEEEVCRQILESGENRTYLPGIKLSENLKPVSSLGESVKDKDVILWVTPSHVARRLLLDALPYIGKASIIVNATKGFEEETLMTMAQMMEAVLPEEMFFRSAYLSGPSFAREVARKCPTAVTVASKNAEVAESVQDIFSTPCFRVYTSGDITGVVVGGAVKNVIAIGAGISDGLDFGNNARAALITRGLAEMTRLAVALGANAGTISGLSGLGDLVLTCTGDLSRNRSLGVRLGRGEKIDSILDEMKTVAEGVKTARALKLLSEKIGAEMPITGKIYSILYEGMDAKSAVNELMTRELKQEIN